MFTQIGGNFAISSRRHYEGVTFRGEGTKITDLQTNARAEEIVRIVLQTQGPALRDGKHIVRMFDPAGFELT